MKKGVLTGYNYNELKPSVFGGLYLEGSSSPKFSAMAELLYFESESKWSYIPYGTYNEITQLEKTKIAQVNFNLKNRIVKRFDCLYGVGASFDVHDQSTIFLDINLGLQFYITHKMPIEIRYNRGIANISGDRSGYPEYNMMFSLAYVF